LQYARDSAASPQTLDLRTVRLLKQSPLALDLYAWVTRRVNDLERPTLISCGALSRFAVERIA